MVGKAVFSVPLHEVFHFCRHIELGNSRTNVVENMHKGLISYTYGFQGTSKLFFILDLAEFLHPACYSPRVRFDQGFELSLRLIKLLIISNTTKAICREFTKRIPGSESPSKSLPFD
ncbi:hypothetical protein BSK56_32815 [Paenibacillus borealis]|uniref:Uncharacterized protein n=1 Tax=Paenibacillus borealis TaxID=160799 RepID=A0ABX3GSQ4_PAEBO|nr:hypothetical protein BSK56_32815 [Paenibacillus borealis]